MAAKRMFAKQVVHSGRFLRMPIEARLLYYELGMEADDDGIVEAVRVIRIVGVSEETLNILVEKGYVTVLDAEDLIIYLNDWNTNNSLRKDKMTPSVYRHLLPKEILDGQTADNGRTLDGQTADNGRTLDGQTADLGIGIGIGIGIDSGSGLGTGTGERRKTEAESVPSTLPTTTPTTAPAPTDNARGLSASASADPKMAEVMTRFLNFIPKASMKTRQQMADYCRSLGAEVCLRAIDAAKEAEPIAKNKLAYLFGILRNREADGIRSGEAWDAHECERSRRNRDMPGRNPPPCRPQNADVFSAALGTDIFNAIAHDGGEL